MIRNIMFAAIAAFALSGCATFQPGGGPTPPTNVEQQTTAVINQVQSITTSVCSFLPTAATIASIFIAGLETPTAIANAICKAVTNKGARRGAVMKVRGVTVRGRFVRSR